jgi:DNA-binding NarL/FixJ family response regulator
VLKGKIFVEGDLTMENHKKGNIHIWLIEDDAGYRKNLRKSLLDCPAIGQIELFASCTPALAALKRGELPDLVLMDLGLPKISGVRGIEKIRKISSNIPIVVLTVFEEKEKVLSALKAGASGYLLKTASEEEIAKGVLQAIKGEVPLNPRITGYLLSGLKGISDASTIKDVTDRERDVLRNMAKGFTIQKSAEELGLSKYTIDFHMRNIYKKLGVGSQTEAVAKAVRTGLI